MGDKNLNKLLAWSLENQDNAEGPKNQGQLDPELLKSLFGGPSEADLMRAAMEHIKSADPEITLESKLTAFDNFEQLIESIDNANNIANLSLWTPLLECLAHEEAEIRRMAAWCVGTAVQNNVQSQEKLLAMGGIPTLVGIAVDDAEDKAVRKKAVYALSSASRNYQPAMDVCVEELGKTGRVHGKVTADDMESVDAVLHPLREEAN